jgi:hypothetical protein
VQLGRISWILALCHIKTIITDIFISDARNIWQQATKTPEINTTRTQCYTQTPNREHKLQGSPNSHNIKMLPPHFHIMASLVQWGNGISDGFLGLSTNGNKNLNPHPFMLFPDILMSSGVSLQFTQQQLPHNLHFHYNTENCCR